MSTQKFGVNLSKGALYELEFLREIVESQKRLQDPELLKVSLFRYEKLWLPFLNKSSRNFLTDLDFTPPIDVHWIWIVHMLSPQQYQVYTYFNATTEKKLDHFKQFKSLSTFVKLHV